MQNDSIAFSGSSTKIQFHLGVAHELTLLGYDPEYLDGCSGGAIVQLFMAIKKFDKEVIETFLNVEAEDVFDVQPLNNKDKLTIKAKIRALLGKSSFGKQNNLLHKEDEYFFSTIHLSVLGQRQGEGT